MSALLRFVTFWMWRKQKVIPGTFQCIVEEAGNETPPPSPPKMRESNSVDQLKLRGGHCDSVFSRSEKVRAALLELYESTRGENWRVNKGWKSVEIEQWWGVKLDRTSLEMEAQCLATDITSLKLMGNGLCGTIPTCIGDLTSLEFLCLQSNLIIGELPETFGQLKNLQSLNISWTNLSGELPTCFGELQNLEELRLRQPGLSGSIPHELGNCTELVVLDLAHNYLSGPIPENLGHLSKLILLDLESNNLSGTVPKELEALKGCNVILAENPNVILKQRHTNREEIRIMTDGHGMEM
eukprot:444526_1